MGNPKIPKYNYRYMHVRFIEVACLISGSSLRCMCVSVVCICLTSPHLSSSGPVAHKAEVLQLALSAATRLASFQQSHPSTRL